MRVNFLGTVHVHPCRSPGDDRAATGPRGGRRLHRRANCCRGPCNLATKFAQVGLTEALAVEVDPFGIGVSLVNPGPVATHFFEARGHPYDRARPRPVNPDQVAQAIMAAVEDDIPEQFTPRWLGTASAIRHVVPALFRSGTRRSFAEELEQEARTR